MRKPQPFFAVRVVVTEVNGNTHIRNYVRGQEHIGRTRFVQRAIGDILTLTGAGEDYGQTVLPRPIHWEVVILKPSDLPDEDFEVCGICTGSYCGHNAYPVQEGRWS